MVDWLPVPVDPAVHTKVIPNHRVLNRGRCGEGGGAARDYEPLTRLGTGRCGAREWCRASGQYLLMDKPAADGNIYGLYAVSVQRIGDPDGRYAVQRIGDLGCSTQQLRLSLLSRSFFLIKLSYPFVDTHVLPPSSSAQKSRCFECGPLANPVSHREAASGQEARYSSKVQQPALAIADIDHPNMRSTLDFDQPSRSAPVATDQKVGGSSPSERAQLTGPLPARQRAFLSLWELTGLARQV
jgi:hypothetical protein